ncbi:Hypothetical predicted protein [Mytilus galloprovincialis]|uniref:RNase H type-1 domain-containing protein n=1 Tax=Mytilus galloprovincialis TaxID=29158 RepID=A0A8B6HMZ2_MYTGA|nr:Hypothetical predicted protein [Mytilus galloprovincialis]
MRAKINKAEHKALPKRNSKGKKAAANPNFNYESSAPSQFNATFPANNQPFRDPQSWYNGQALYHGQASQASTSEKTSWNSCIVLSKASLIQINFWKENLGRVNVKSFTSDFSCQSVVYSDASNTGYGGYIVETPFNIAHGMWSECESTKSSTWKELNAVKHILLSVVDILKWFSDNQNVVSIVAKGSMKPELQDIALCIFENCLTHNISIDAEWVPRTFNEKADFISRIIDYDDWGVGEQLFTYLDSLWGPHEIDWFANDDNHKLTVFYSRYWTVNSIGIDAFTVNWNGVNGWFVPPVCLVSKVLRYMRQCMAQGTIVLPLWKSASYWPILCPTGEGFIKEVKDVLTYLNREILYPW